ncbi:MAG: hypothetical protein U0X74_01905 [Anaerolineales bacterium]
MDKSGYHKRVLHNQKRPTKRAPDAGDSAAISSSFLRLIIFLAGRLRRPCPSAGNANRWAVPCKMKIKFFTAAFLFISLISCTPAMESVTISSKTYPPCTTQNKAQPSPLQPASNYTSFDISSSLTLIEFQDNYLGIPTVESGCFYNFRDRAHVTEINLDNHYQIITTPIDSENELVTVSKREKIIYKSKIRTSTYSGLLEAWGYQDHWVIEIVTANGVDIIQDGLSLKEKSNYQKVFAFQLLNDKPFYFFEKPDYGFGINYYNDEIQLEYDDIPYYNPAPGSGGTIYQFQNMVLFYGVKNGVWQQAIIGSFK